MRKLIVSLALVLLAAPAAFAGETPKTGEFGNHCAMGLTMGKQVQTDCKINWTDPTSNKTFCFSSEEMKSEWAKNTAANTKKATEQFATLATSAANAVKKAY
jgi:hypothetical protein